jgi:hypothetical protein
MKIRTFTPAALVGIAGLGALTDRLGVPPVPFMVIATFASILMTLQLEDQRWGKFVREVWQALQDAMQDNTRQQPR